VLDRDRGQLGCGPVSRPGQVHLAAGGNVDAIGDVDAAIDYIMGQAEDDDLAVVAGSNTVAGRIRSISDELQNPPLSKFGK
jgi:hypothetical protein